MDKNNIIVYQGVGLFVDKIMVVIIDGEGNKMMILIKNMIIVIGFKLNFFLGMESDKDCIIIFIEVLKMKEILKKFIVIGGGVIGFEFGFVYVCFGVEVEVVEFVDVIFLIMDCGFGKEFIKILKKEGFKFNFEISV